MKKIFISVLIILLDFSLTASGYSVGLIPDFIGFWLLSDAIIAFKEKSIYFNRIYLLSSFMIFFSLVSYCLDCFGNNISNYALLFMIQLFYTLMCLYVIYLVILGIKDTVILNKINLNTNKLSRYFLIYTSVIITIFIQMIIPDYAYVRYIAILVTCPLFLIELYKIIQKYSNLNIVIK